MLRFSVLFATLFLSACSRYHLSTNLDKENFDEYFKPSQVSVYSKSALKTLDYEILGAVEGSSCQEESNQLPADIKVARTNARINAANMHANGIVINSCLSFEADATCLSNVICYGQALDVSIDKDG